MYYIILYGLIVFSLYEIHTGRTNRLWFNVFYLLMTYVAVFRYGQFVDYFAYSYLYNNWAALITKEPFFVMLVSIFQMCHLNYTVFAACMSFIMMLLLYPFFNRVCKGKIIALLFFYCYIFQMCVMGAMRQGLCVSLLLFMYYYYTMVNRKKIILLIGWIIGCLIHTSFFAVIFIPLIMKLRLFNKRIISLVVIFCTVIAFAKIDVTSFLFPFLKERALDYVDVSDSNVTLQIGLRSLLFFPLLFLAPKVGTTSYHAKSICLFGFCLYCLLANNVLIAGRIEYFFRVFYCVVGASIISMAINLRYKKMLMVYLVCLHCFMWFKNVGSFIESGNYREGITVFNFPYVSVFDKSELRENALVEKEMLPYL